MMLTIVQLWIFNKKKQACSSRCIFNLCAWTDYAEHCRQSEL